MSVDERPADAVGDPALASTIALTGLSWACRCLAASDFSGILTMIAVEEEWPYMSGSFQMEREPAVVWTSVRHDAGM